MSRNTNTVHHKIQFNVTQKQLWDIDDLAKQFELGSRSELFRFMIREFKKQASGTCWECGRTPP